LYYVTLRRHSYRPLPASIFIPSMLRRMHLVVKLRLKNLLNLNLLEITRMIT
jgi:hypothetical protein